jgi:hypothetical protein
VARAHKGCRANGGERERKKEVKLSITVAARYKARSNSGIVGPNPTRGMGVCVRLFSVFVLFCVWVAALRRADPSSKESYRLCIGLRN